MKKMSKDDCNCIIGFVVVIGILLWTLAALLGMEAIGLALIVFAIWLVCALINMALNEEYCDSNTIVIVNEIHVEDED